MNKQTFDSLNTINNVRAESAYNLSDGSLALPTGQTLLTRLVWVEQNLLDFEREGETDPGFCEAINDTAAYFISCIGEDMLSAMRKRYAEKAG